MTALDDALNSGTPQFDPLGIEVDWVDAPKGNAGNPNLDNPSTLTRQVGPNGWRASHSFEDGLPDPVTMTTGSDANGNFSAEVIGREGVYAQQLGWRQTATGTGTGSDVSSITLPTGVTWDDYCIVAFSLNRFDAQVVETSGDWDVLSRQQDGDAGFGLVTYVFGCRWYNGLSGPVLDWAGSYAYSWVSAAAYARTADGAHYLRVEPDRDRIVSDAETVSGTNHTAPITALLDRRGWLVSAWSSIAGTPQWTPPAGHTELGESAATVTLMLATSPEIQAGPDYYALAATTAGPAGTVTETVIPLQIYDRPDMEAYQYFSPFLETSPVYGYEREGNPTEVTFNVVTGEGVVGTRVFKGQTADIELKDQHSAELLGISRTRVDMNAVVNLPKVPGYLLGMSIDWVLTYLLAYGGQFIGPAPSKWARWWNPYYGSAKPVLTGPFEVDNDKLGFDFVRGYFLSDPGVAKRFSTFQHTGPHHLAMFAEQSSGHTREIEHEIEFSVKPMPHQAAQEPEWEPEDLLSQQNMAGRISFWIRGDPWTSPPVAGGIDVLARFILNRRLKDNTTHVSYLQVYVSAADGNVCVNMDGETYFWPAIGALTADGQWHFVGVQYDLLARKAKVKLDGLSISEYTFSASSTTALYPATDAAGLARGDVMTKNVRFHLPVSDVQWEIGREPYESSWTDLYPPKDPGNTPGSYSATVRPTGYLLPGLFDDTPYPVWDTVAALARSSAAWYRSDEDDQFNFLPLEYFGETDQMEPVGELDTLVNAQALQVVTDPSKMRNSVTVKYLETELTSSTEYPVFTLTSALTIPRGYSRVTFPLEVPIVEAWSELNPGSGEGGNWTLDNLTADHANGTTPLPAGGHYIFFNRNPDGSGEYLKYLGARARIVEATATTITVEFQNTARLPIYVVNNGTDKPFLQLRGTAVVQRDAYVTVRDDVGIRRRRERALEAELPWVMTREHATDIANRILAVTHLPRPQVTVSVMGDPRRRPGQLFVIKDARGTAASGSWRAIAISHEGSGPKYVQTIELIKVGDVARWDLDPGWDQSVWGE